MNAESGSKSFQFNLGLQNLADKYLTIESFANKINASGAALGQKQKFTLILNQDETISLLGNNGKYLSSDRYGNVTCGKEEIDSEAKYVLTYINDGTGRCSLKHSSHGYYVGGLEDNIQCMAKTASEAEMSLWYFQLSEMPQGRLVNLDKARYVRLNGEELQCNKDSPWGKNSLITLEYVSGKYAIKTANGKYLCRDGSLVDDHGNDTKFAIELKMTPECDRAGMIFKDKDGHSLMPYGTYGKMKAKEKGTGNSQYFLMETIPTEVMVTASNGKNASVSQGPDINVTTNEESQTEIFQINHHEKSNKWTLKTADGNYWKLGAASVIQSNGNEIADDSLFDISWRRNGTVSMKASNGKYVAFNLTKALNAKSDEVKEKEIFQIKIINRPILILKGEFGYVGMKKNSSTQEYGCNKPVAETILMERGENGTYHLKGINGKYLTVADDDKIVATETNPKPFVIEIVSDGVMTIRGPNDKYLVGEKNGKFSSSADKVSNMAMWKF